MHPQAHKDTETLSHEHQVQLGLFKALSQAVRERWGREDTREILDQLIQYTDVHFSSEAVLMRLHAFPQFDAHTTEHDDLMGQIQDIQEQFLNEDRTATLKDLARLEDWLTRHIETKDRAFAKYLEGQGVTAETR